VNAVDLFAGHGGVACAMRELGLDARHVELDVDACDTLTAAGFRDVVQADVRDLGAWRPQSPTGLLWGSPPCPKWSRANRRRDRIPLAVDGWSWMLDAVRALRPTLVCVENVKDAPTHRWASDLRAEGYHTGEWRLDAADFGEAQRRRRRFVVASRVAMPLAPVPTHGDPRLGLAPPRSMRDILDPQGDRHVYRPGTGRAASEPWRLDLPTPTVMCTEVKGTRASSASGWTFHGGPDRLSEALFLALGWRRATLAECARAQGFPEAHPFRGTSEARYRGAGNAVPRTLALAVLRAALATLDAGRV